MYAWNEVAVTGFKNNEVTLTEGFTHESITLPIGFVVGCVLANDESPLGNIIGVTAYETGLYCIFVQDGRGTIVLSQGSVRDINSVVICNKGINDNGLVAEFSLNVNYKYHAYSFYARVKRESVKNSEIKYCFSPAGRSGLPQDVVEVLKSIAIFITKVKDEASNKMSSLHRH